MSKEVYIVSDHLISPLGNNSEENFKSLMENKSGIKPCSIHQEDVNYLSLIDEEKLINYFPFWNELSDYTRLEKVCIASIKSALEDTNVDLKDNKTLLLLSTTKGNIDLLDQGEVNREKLFISSMANTIGGYFQCANKVQTVSIACISGVAALNIATRSLQLGKYDNVIVCGGDIINNFTLSGFTAFNAVADEPCKPFDKNRLGVSLGEAIGTIILSSKEKKTFIVFDGGICNDANHISAPSRTGEGVFRAVKRALDKYQISEKEIDFISAHGTATMYNDEMEAHAFNRLSLSDTPLNSFKGYFGHTLGGAGVIESIMTLHSMKNNLLISSKGFSELGTTLPLDVITENHSKEINLALKTASGFGGCNAAILFQKISDYD